MYTPDVALMDMDWGTLARIDRKLLAGRSDDEAHPTVRVLADEARWSTWKQYCDSVGISMGRADTMLMDQDLPIVFGEHTAGEWPMLTHQTAEKLANREARFEVREHTVDAHEARIRERSERLRR